MRDVIAFEANIPAIVTLVYPTGKIVPGRNGDRVMYTLEGEQVMFLDLGVAEKINQLAPKQGDSIGICKYVRKGKPPAWEAWLTPATEAMRAVRAGEVPARSLTAKRLPPPDPDESELAQQLRGSVQNIQEGRPAAAPRPRPIAPAIAERLDSRDYAQEQLGTGTNGGRSTAGARVSAPAPATATTPALSNGHHDNNGHGITAGQPPIAQGWAQLLLSVTNALVDVYAAALAQASAQHGNQVKPEDVRALLTSAFISQTKNGGPNVA